ncbi:PqqD family peptide modification chaperone [Rothia nasimurium]|uniref:PqqD family peptide modification chaperone n=1 Tax=Rothia nasimurium TaxID=85336 RepID=UPI002DD66DF1|nr:PqqD family peptide modification chaperone [Rothia nasimurium]
MSIEYRRAPHTAFIMGVDSTVSPDDASYVANLKTSEIAVLQGPSAVIWEILETPINSEDLIAEITDIYQVSHDTVAASVIGFLSSLEAQGLVEVKESAGQES